MLDQFRFRVSVAAFCWPALQCEFRQLSQCPVLLTLPESPQRTNVHPLLLYAGAGLTIALFQPGKFHYFFFFSGFFIQSPNVSPHHLLALVSHYELGRGGGGHSNLFCWELRTCVICARLPPICIAPGFLLQWAHSSWHQHGASVRRH